MIFVLALALPSLSSAADGSDRSLDSLRLWLQRGNARPSMFELEEELLAVAREINVPWSRPSCTLLSGQFEVVCTGASLCRMWNHKSLRILPSLRSSWSVCEGQLQPTNSGGVKEAENETRAATVQQYEPGRTVYNRREHLHGKSTSVIKMFNRYPREGVRL